MLADKGDDASATEVGLEESSLAMVIYILSLTCFFFVLEESSQARDIHFVTNILLSALEKKVNKLDFVRITFFLMKLVQ